jgi:hypothetical protein
MINQFGVKSSEFGGNLRTKIEIISLPLDGGGCGWG